MTTATRGGREAPVIPRPATYSILHEGKAIRCDVCKCVSWHPQDVEHRYCASCKAFHDEGSDPSTQA